MGTLSRHSMPATEFSDAQPLAQAERQRQAMTRHPQSQSEWRDWLVSEKPSLTKQLELWLRLAQSPNGQTGQWANCELREEGVVVLVRSGTNCVPSPCLVVATIQVKPEAQGKGLFKAFLARCWHLNPWPRLVIEDVANPNLRSFLLRVGAYVFCDFYPTTFEVPRSSLAQFSAEPLLSYSSYATRRESGA